MRKEPDQKDLPDCFSFCELAVKKCYQVLGFLGFPKIESRGNPREISRQILLSLHSSTREAACRKGRSSELWLWLRGCLCLAAFISWGQSRLTWTSWLFACSLFEKGKLAEFFSSQLGDFLFQLPGLVTIFCLRCGGKMADCCAQ